MKFLVTIGLLAVGLHFGECVFLESSRYANNAIEKWEVIKCTEEPCEVAKSGHPLLLRITLRNDFIRKENYTGPVDVTYIGYIPRFLGYRYFDDNYPVTWGYHECQSLTNEDPCVLYVDVSYPQDLSPHGTRDVLFKFISEHYASSGHPRAPGSHFTNSFTGGVLLDFV